MIKLYEKNELTFSLVWIGFYVVLYSAADNLSTSLGTAKIITAPLSIVMAFVLLVWITRNGLKEKCGLCKVKADGRKYLFFFPLVIIASTNLWNGFALHMTLPETALYIVSMLCVGFIEEIIFRGFLFNALRKDNVRQAIIISSLTFGIGHIVNLLNGAELLETMLQICYAAAIGFLFTVIFYTSGSLIPCVITHSAINSLSAVAGTRTERSAIVGAVVLTAISLFYAIWILKKR